MYTLHRQCKILSMYTIHVLRYEHIKNWIRLFKLRKMSAKRPRIAFYPKCMSKCIGYIFVLVFLIWCSIIRRSRQIFHSPFFWLRYCKACFLSLNFYIGLLYITGIQIDSKFSIRLFLMSLVSYILSLRIFLNSDKYVVGLFEFVVMLTNLFLSWLR